LGCCPTFPGLWEPNPEHAESAYRSNNSYYYYYYYYYYYLLTLLRMMQTTRLMREAVTEVISLALALAVLL